MSSLVGAGTALLRAGHFAAAERLLYQAATSFNDAVAWQLLGAARHKLGKRDGAREAWAKALTLDPALSDAACALATVLADEERWRDAEAVLRKALEAQPAETQVHFNLAVLLERRGAGEEALGHYDAALAGSNHAGALLNRGALKMRLGRPAEALLDFERIVRDDPRSVDAHVNRNRALLILQQDEVALEAAQAALDLSPGRRDARLGKAIALASLGRVEEAQREMSTEQGWDAGTTYLTRALERQDSCNWSDRQRLLGLLRERLATPDAAASMASVGLLHRALALPLDGRQIRLAATAIASTLRAPRLGALPRVPAQPRIRLAFLSAGVSTHPDYFLMCALLQELDRQRFEVALYAFNADDASEHRVQMARAADTFVDVSALDAASMAARIRADAPEVAIDTGGFFVAARPEVLKARVAPVQVAYLGVPATYGPGLVDYRLSDPLATPPADQAQWAEKLVLVPAPHYVYHCGVEASAAGVRRDHGLPDEGTVYCCFNQSWKIEPEAFDVWMRVLRGTPGSVLWLLDGGDRVRANLRRAAEARGVTKERLVFGARVPFAAHIGRLAHADVFLDTFHYNAVTTALDTLWAGVPVVTREGTTMSSRLGATFVRSAGLDELVAASSEEYERIAVRLGTDQVFLALAKAKARAARTSGAFDVPTRVRDLERAFIAMVQRHRSGAGPEAMDLSASG